MSLSKKEKFIEFVKLLMNEIQYDNWDDEVKEEWSDALDYWNGLQAGGSGSASPQFTENGIKVLSFVKEHKDDFNNLFKAKDIAQAIGVTSRSVSGAMRKLVNDGYIEKVGEQPIIYMITEKGINTNLP